MGVPNLAINVVAFDPEIVGDKEEEEYFKELAGPDGSFMIDTTQDDLLALDKMLKAVGVKKKQLDKIDKKRSKMEDLSQMQTALQAMLVNDFEICDWALKNEAPIPGP